MERDPRFDALVGKVADWMLGIGFIGVCAFTIYYVYAS